MPQSETTANPEFDAAQQSYNKFNACLITGFITALVMVFVGVWMAATVGDARYADGHAAGVTDALNHPERFVRVASDQQWVGKGEK